MTRELDRFGYDRVDYSQLRVFSNPGPPTATCKAKMKPSILELSPQQVVGWLADRNQPKFRAAQIRKWLFEGRARTLEDLTDLPKALRTDLEKEFSVWTLQIVRHLASEDGTEKLLLQTHDGGRIECVLIREAARRTICISTQVGCAMGCVFCARQLLHR